MVGAQGVFCLDVVEGLVFIDGGTMDEHCYAYEHELCALSITSIQREGLEYKSYLV